MNPARCRVLLENKGEAAKTVLYWTLRDLRADHNWALLHAQELARKFSQNLAVLYVLVPNYVRYTWRHYHFLIQSLKELDADLFAKNIPLYVVEAEHDKVAEKVIKVAKDIQAGTLVCDLNPMRSPMGWIKEIVDNFTKSKAKITVEQVDAHNVVPIWVTSPKMEWAARTIRPKIHSNMREFTDAFPNLDSMPPNNLDVGVAFPFALPKRSRCINDWERIERDSLTMQTCDRTVPPVDAYHPPGSRAAHERLSKFLAPEAIGKQASRRNDPNYKQVLSGLSPYFNWGLISTQYVVQKVQEWDRSTSKRYHDDVEAFLEETVVRRELSDNFCFYNPHYDSLRGGPEWGQITLGQHESDRREHVYTYEEWEACQTHDMLWNAANMQLRKEGKLHGFLRMYWAKKILEWSASPEEALDYAIRMNDKWALDGNDNPNGYVGVMWSICGVHDQGWAERAVFGKIRYMNDTGCKRKFDVPKFIAAYPVDVELNIPNKISVERANHVKEKGDGQGVKKRTSSDALAAAHKAAVSKKIKH